MVVRKYFLLKGPMKKCVKCGFESSDVSAEFCSVCGSAPSSSLNGKKPSEGIAWENVKDLGIVRALFNTCTECIVSPFVFFEKISPNPNVKMSFLYALILGSIGSIVGFLWTTLILSWIPIDIPWLNSLSSKTSSAAGLIFFPFISAIKTVFSAAYFQALLVLTRSKKRNIASTFSIVCYTESAAVLNVIPGIGGILSLIWSFVLLVAGLNRVHKISTVKASLIIFLPLLALFILGILALALLVGAGMFLEGLL